MTDFPELLILRHGETEWNRQGRMQGALDSPLTENGRSQAKIQGRLIAQFGAKRYNWYASPQGRAVETARIVSKDHSVEFIKDLRLREIEMGEWAGQMRKDIQRTVPHLFEDPAAMAWYGQAPGGESLEDLAVRIGSFLSELSGPSVIVTHGITSRILRCVVLGLPLTAFSALEGGQGILYRLAGDSYEKIGPEGVVPQNSSV